LKIYEKLGIKTGINAVGTVTRLGGTRLSNEVAEAMVDAGKFYIPMFEFHKKAGEYVAGLLDVEGCCITCGAAAGLAISSAACMTKGESSKVLQLPDTTGMPNEVLILKAHRILYDQALGLSGIKVRELGEIDSATIDLVKEAISEKTALFMYIAEREDTKGSIPLSALIPLLRQQGVPLVVDAAAEIPPVENINKYLDLGVDLILFSGGKEIRGPQTSGLILGKKELIDACNANCCPNYSIGRAMKISKETVAGLVAAIEVFVRKDYTKQQQMWEEMSGRIYASLENRNDVSVRLGYPTEPGTQPTSILRVYIKPLKLDVADMQDKLLNQSTPVYVDIVEDEIVINPQCLETGELEPLIEILIQTLGEN